MIFKSSRQAPGTSSRGSLLKRDSAPAEQDTKKSCSSSEPDHRELSRSTIVIGIVSLFADISTEVMYPLLPAFVTDILKAPVTALGLIEGVAQGVSSVVSGISGWLSDRLGQRRLVAFAGYAFTAVSKPIIGAAGTWPVVLAARFGDRLGKGVRTAPKDALLADSVHAGQRGRAFGYERAMDSTGAVAGPLLALVLAGWLGLGARTIFYLATIPAGIAALLILAVRDQGGGSRARESVRISIAGTTSHYRRLMIVTAVFGLANSANAFLILRASRLGLGTGWTILAYALYNAIAAIVSMPAGSASDRIGRRNLLVIGYAIYALVYAGFGAATSPWAVCLSSRPMVSFLPSRMESARHWQSTLPAKQGVPPQSGFTP